MKRVLAILLTACGGAQTQAPSPAEPATPVAAEPATPAPPPAPTARVTTRRDAIVDTVHGTPVADPYRWLEKVDTPETTNWVTEQDAAARRALAALPGRDAIVKRMNELTYIDSIGVPLTEGGRFFYSRNFADKEKSIYFVREGEKGAERALLDPNTMSEDGSVSLNGVYPSRNGKLVAWKRAANNADESTLYIRDVATGKDLPDVIEGAKYAAASWTKDSKGFYYTWVPTDPSLSPMERPGKQVVRYHQLGTDPAKDPIIFPARNDSSGFTWGGLSRDGKWLFLYLGYGTTRNDVYFRRNTGKPIPMASDSLDPTAHGFTKLVAGPDASYSVVAHDDKFYVTSDEGAPKSRIFVVDPKKPDRASWKEIVAEPSEPGAALLGTAVIGGHLLITYLKDLVSEIEIRKLDGTLVRKVELPGVGSASSIRGLPERDDVYYQFSSPTFTPQIWRTSVKTGRSQLWQKIQVPVDLSPYVTTLVWVPSTGGVKVPTFLVHRKDMQKNGQNPVLLYGYGGFNVSISSYAAFSASWTVWLEHGGVVVLPGLRGGGELGEDWHRDGMLDKKQHTFDDFAAVAEWLVKEKISQPKKIAIYGGSNGGLLVGALMVQRPELVGAVACGVPLLDMVRYHLFGSGKTWISEYGSAEDAAQFKTLLAYSPYHQVKQGVAYPPLLMLSADSDDRVDPLHARKFVAQVQWATDRPESALLRVEGKAGHTGADMRKKNVEKTVDLYAWLFATLRMN
jgi:prolyl oligopeptidase